MPPINMLESAGQEQVLGVGTAVVADGDSRGAKRDMAVAPVAVEAVYAYASGLSLVVGPSCFHSINPCSGGVVRQRVRVHGTISG